MGDLYAPPGAANDPNGTNATWPDQVRGFWLGRGGNTSGGPNRGGGITAPAGTPVQGGMVTVYSPSGKAFKVDPRYAENFRGFLKDYEEAGGVIGPNSGTLGTRGNKSGHPIGTAVDINQVDRNVRRGGVTLSPEQEEAIAKRWGFVNGANFSNPDAGHFGIQSEEAARRALERNGIIAAPQKSGIDPAQLAKIKVDDALNNLVQTFRVGSENALRLVSADARANALTPPPGSVSNDNSRTISMAPSMNVTVNGDMSPTVYDMMKHHQMRLYNDLLANSQTAFR
jgi:hypothetical protein